MINAPMTEEEFLSIVGCIADGFCPDCSSILHEKKVPEVGPEVYLTWCPSCSFCVLHGLVFSDGLNHTFGFIPVDKKLALHDAGESRAGDEVQKAH